MVDFIYLFNFIYFIYAPSFFLMELKASWIIIPSSILSYSFYFKIKCDKNANR